MTDADKLAEIKKRHDAVPVTMSGDLNWLDDDHTLTVAREAHADRATLLRLLDEAMRAALRELRDAYIGSVACDYPVCIGGECDHECERDEKSVEMFRDPLIAAIRALDAAGYVLLPKEPTREMWAASGTEICNASLGRVHHDKITETVWTAMLAAAPKLPQGGET